MNTDEIIRDWMMQVSVADMNSSSILEDELESLNVSVRTQLQAIAFNHFPEPLFACIVNQHSIPVKSCFRVKAS